LAKKTIENEINEFLELWDVDSMISFLTSAFHLTELYNVEEEDDWVEKIVGPEQVITIRSIRTVYLMSKFAELQAGKLASTRVRFKDLWKRLEKIDR